MSKKILILNWRSFFDPKAGGAERVTFEHARRWVKEFNAQVVWLSPAYEDCSRLKIYEGITFRHIGIPFSEKPFFLIFSFSYFYFLVFIHVVFKYNRWADVLVDQVHGMPYMTPLYRRKKVVVFIHEVADSVYDKMFTFPISVVGRFLEKLSFTFYKKTKFVCVSESCKQDLVSVGVPIENISVVLNGLTLDPISAPAEKEESLTLVFLNRIVKMKGIERALEVFSLVLKDHPDAKMWIIGKYDFEYHKKLLKLASELRIDKKITFFGFVPEKEKQEMLRRAHCLINPSYKEGWGLVNIEANSQGTPAVCYDVAGNRDSIVSGINGYVVAEGDVAAMALAVASASKDKKLWQSSIEYSRQFDWAESSRKFYNELNDK